MASGLLIETINEHEAEIADLKRQLAESREQLLIAMSALIVLEDGYHMDHQYKSVAKQALDQMRKAGK